MVHTIHGDECKAGTSTADGHTHGSRSDLSQVAIESASHIVEMARKYPIYVPRAQHQQFGIIETPGCRSFTSTRNLRKNHQVLILSPNSINNIAWDKSRHVYATSRARHKLYVFTVTPLSISEVTGSPFTLSAPSTVVVKPL